MLGWNRLDLFGGSNWPRQVDFGGKCDSAVVLPLLIMVSVHRLVVVHGIVRFEAGLLMTDDPVSSVIHVGALFSVRCCCR